MPSDIGKCLFTIDAATDAETKASVTKSSTNIPFLLFPRFNSRNIRLDPLHDFCTLRKFLLPSENNIQRNPKFISDHLRYLSTFRNASFLADATPQPITRGQSTTTIQVSASMAISATQFTLLCVVGIILLARPAHAFGAGNIGSTSKIEGENWRHGDLEDTFLTLVASSAMGGKKFSKLDVKRVSRPPCELHTELY